VREIDPLEQTTWLFPETATVVVCDADNPALVDLAWDLGARFVLHPPHARRTVAGRRGGLARRSRAARGEA